MLTASWREMFPCMIMSRTSLGNTISIAYDFCLEHQEVMKLLELG